ncbi:hypothetical protein BD770DRAFT_424093 [Pilaira anomala]|nr:hypothetical protein BD770DRAFT_424093 [Pilaira anomala]
MYELVLRVLPAINKKKRDTRRKGRCLSSKPRKKSPIGLLSEGNPEWSVSPLLNGFVWWSNISSCEWKFETVSAATTRRQECKNSGINASILKAMRRLSVVNEDESPLRLIYSDWVERDGTINMIVKEGDVFVVTKLGDIFIPASLHEIGNSSKPLNHLIINLEEKHWLSRNH